MTADPNGLEAMAATKETGGRRALKRKIIERPRLIGLLDESPSRVKTLVAPAGYGKTTLAEQWVGKKGRRGAWFTARPSSSDVAALALGLARAATEIVPECDVRLREHLRALPAPAEHVDVLAELLGEDLEAWPDDAWLVIDDYQELSANADAEKLVEELLAVSPLQLLIASRLRPSWITARRILYGEILELNQTALAMDSQEAAQVLSERNLASASGLVALAHGWPAVVGLASVSAAEIDQSEAVPESLYQFFAEEVFSSLPEGVQVGLGCLAIAPVIDRSLAANLLGEACQHVCGSALDVGILVEHGDQLVIHPLARAFLEDRLDSLSVARDPKAVELCLDYFLAQRDWDAAFDLVTRQRLPSRLGRLLEEALDDLLETARLSTIESWCDFADDAGIEGAIFALSRAEVALRRGRLAAAQAHGERVASTEPARAFRALSIAGRAAHLESREDEALRLFRRAEASTTDDALKRAALWDQALCMIELEMPEVVDLVEGLASSASKDDPREVLRAVCCRSMCQTRFGRFDLEEADRAAQLLPIVRDPIVETGFLSMYATGLAISARYDDARRVADDFISTARRYRLDFALPYALCAAGVADAGRRQWEDAIQALRQGAADARTAANAHGEQSCTAALIRTFAQCGQLDAALALVQAEPPQLTGRVPVAMRGELVATGALVLAAAERVEEASRRVQSVRGLSRSIEPVVLVAAVDAIVSTKRHDPDAIERVNALLQAAFTTGALDLLVTVYRAVPELLAIMLRSPHAGSLAELLHRIGDDDVAERLGHPVGITQGSAAPLTARETEVYELLRQGLSNREIAKLLYIAETTAKLHVQHVYNKLGVRSRKAIAMRAALERSSQATSAIDETGADEDS